MTDCATPCEPDDALQSKPLRRWTPQGTRRSQRDLATETPVAIVFNGTTVAVMMATPAHIADFALGFAVSEGYVSDRAQIDSFEVVHHGPGIEARFWLSAAAARLLAERRRASLGAMGCGLCGIDSLSEALRPLPVVTSDIRFSPARIAAATEALRAHQPLQDRTRAVHAAGFLTGEGLAVVREDVGRHNALDKLAGALLSQAHDSRRGAIVMTSRLSVDLVQKTAMIGCAVLIGRSAPSGLAVDTAQAAGITLIGTCRDDGFDVFSHPKRIAGLDA